MDAREYASRRPGSSNAPASPELPGAITATVGTDWASARSRRRVLSAARVAMPVTATAAATTTRMIPATRSLLREMADGAGSCGMELSKGCAGRGLAAVARVHDAEDDGHEHEGCDGGEDEAADHCAAEGRILLA